jgi:uncharacterized protein
MTNIHPTQITRPSQTRSPIVVDTSRSPHALLRPVSVTAVKLEDQFWLPRLRANKEVSLPAQFEQLETTGRLDNFRRVTGETDKPYEGLYFNDSDVYKWLEGAAWALAQGPDETLERLVNEAISLVEAAQDEDGYLNTYFSLEREPERWTNLRDMHEMYCAGHLIQAAVAHQRATGGDRLMRVARRNADLICATFGPAESGRRPGVCGHEEIELALVELYRQTGEHKYLEQARYFIDARGHEILEPGGRFTPDYYQDHKPLRELEQMVGHAVRALYLNAGAADLYLEEGDQTILTALERLWTHMTSRQMYVSSGLGARHEGEAFGEDFELPNAKAYTETCAAIGSVMWDHRMLAATGHARYADLIEATLLNAILPGWSLDAKHYFYENPLEDAGGHRRQPWFHCACCPPNVARTVASIPGYIYSTSEDAVWVHLYVQNTAQLEINGQAVQISQRTNYPWDGEIELELHSEGEFGLHLRIPEWCESGATLSVNGIDAGVLLQPGSYAKLRRRWTPGDTVRLALPMPVRFLESHPRIFENVSRMAVMRGPLLYCIEGVDHPGVDLREIEIDLRQPPLSEWRSDLLKGVAVLRGQARVRLLDEAWQHQLYRPVHPGAIRPSEPVEITMIPYFAWANREAGAMQIWLRRQESA